MPSIHEQVNDEAIGVEKNIVIKVASLSTEAIKWTIKKYQKAIGDEVKHGKQTLKELAEQNAGLSSIELSSPDLRELNRVMDKCGVDFAPVKADEGKYLLFFKSRDADAITHAFNQYAKKIVDKGKKPSVREHLGNMKEKAAQLKQQHKTQFHDQCQRNQGG